MIEFARQWWDVAGDGFKAEILWWAWATGTRHDLPVTTWQHAEWAHFAAWVAPGQYALTDRADYDTRTFYGQAQSWACAALHTDADVALIQFGEHNTDCHAVIWASGFGQRTVEGDPTAAIVAGLESPDDNTHAMSVLAMRLLGRAADLRPGIADAELTPETYHAALVAQVAAHLPRN